eukprot:TRINITY_DN2097_c0_g1_i1.p1 TRINITY_DN2097_c0_g1~~TRINITY_DN2097_c0_g1_i1.p1  ORF type:complete len:497 (-),score=121.66 TRINITY_DN2097_c0_g1_i1:87-1577(-)
MSSDQSNGSEGGFLLEDISGFRNSRESDLSGGDDSGGGGGGGGGARGGGEGGGKGGGEEEIEFDRLLSVDVEDDLGGSGSSSSSSSDSFLLETSAPLPPDLFDSGSGSQFIEPRSCSCRRSCFSFLFALFDFLTSNYFNILLCAVPFSMLSYFVPAWDPIVMFLLSGLSLIPLSWQLNWTIIQFGWCLEKDFGHPGAPFIIEVLLGSSSEFLIGFMLLVHGNHAAAKVLAIGVVLSRLMFSSGFALIFSRENRPSRGVSSPSLSLVPLETLSSIILALLIPVISPAMFTLAKVSSAEGVIRLSRWLAIVIILAGVGVGVYLIRNRHLFMVPSKYRPERAMRLGGVVVVFCIVSLVFVVEAFLFASSLLPTSQKYGLSSSFGGAMVVPLLSQISTSISSIRHATHGSLPSSLKVNLLQSIISLFHQAVYCLISWPLSVALHQFTTLTLSVPIVFVMAIVVSSILTKTLLKANVSHVLMGVVMVSVYVSLAIISFYHP